MAFQKKNINTDKLNDFINNGKDNKVNVNVNVNNKYNLGINKETGFENLYKRQTFYIHKDLIEKLNQFTVKAPKGEKTRILNEALEQYLENL